MDPERRRLRWKARCVVCGVELPAGSWARWDSERKVASCDACPTAGAADLMVMGRAGASADRQFNRRSALERSRYEKSRAEDAGWRLDVKAKHPILGRIRAVLRRKPRAAPLSPGTKAWDIGAKGERRVAKVLDRCTGVRVLHDVGVPGSSANIDHIVIGPGGVFVVDAKLYKRARVGRRVFPGPLAPVEQLVVGGRDKTDMVRDIHAQAGIVYQRAGPELADTWAGVHTILCFVGTRRFREPLVVGGVTVTRPRALARHVTKAGPLGPEDIGRIQTQLVRTLRLR
jgi:hypothetical protein